MYTPPPFNTFHRARDVNTRNRVVKKSETYRAENLIPKKYVLIYTLFPQGNRSLL